MQRQSLGSPLSKLVVKDEQLIITNEITQLNNKKQFPPPAQSLSISNLTGFMLFSEEEKCTQEQEQLKKKKKKNNNSSGRHETYIHLIPMLTLLCFLILYLSSHNPSQNDLAQFNGFKAFSNTAADLEDSISELQRVMEIKKGDILAVRSLKNFKAAAEEATAKHRRLHRKIARNF
ncbi:hypothetical protein ACP275_05G073100 [Erythranthe tilingii]